MVSLIGSQTQLKIFLCLTGRIGLEHCYPSECVVKLKHTYFFLSTLRAKLYIVPSYAKYHIVYSAPIWTRAVCVMYAQVHVD